MNLFIATSVLLSSLILTVSAGTNNDDGEMVLARLVIHGLPNELTSQDMEMVYQAVAPLSNESPPIKPSLRANVIAVSDESEEADEDSQMLGKTAPTRGYTCGGWGCGGWDPRNPQHQRSRWWGFGPDYSCGSLCRNDDAIVTTMATVLVTAPASTSAAELCKQFQSSNSPALSQAQHCSLTIMEEPSVASICVDGTKVGEALVFVDGMSDQDWTDQEADVLAHSVLAAYNRIYAPVQALTSFTALNTATPPTAASTVVMGEFHQTCSKDNNSEPDATQHALFEGRLCRELRESGLPLFADAKNCAFRTFRSPPVTTMKQSADAAAIAQ